MVTESRHLKSQKKSIQDAATWTEAFLTFATIRNKKHPSHTNDLLAYGAMIVRGAKEYKGSGWLSCDFQYRRLAAARGNLGNWGQRDVALWNDTVCKPGCNDNSKLVTSDSAPEDSHGQKRRPPSSQIGNPNKKTKPIGKDKQWKASVCYQYSYAGKCGKERCSYLHICYDCGGAHSQSSCPKKEA